MTSKVHRKALLNSHSESIRLSQPSASLADFPAQTPPESPDPKPHIPPGTKAVIDTPSRSSCDGPQKGHPTVAAMTPMLEDEIKWTTQKADDSFFKRVVKKRVKQTEASISQFVNQSGLYNRETKRWNNLNRATALEKDLYPHFYKIFQQVLQTFDVKQRELVPTFNIRIKHIEGSEGNSKLKTSPDIFIYGSGPNFQADNLQLKLEEKANYRYCASPCEVKTEKNLNEVGVVTQVAVYARQCFIQQGNRQYVYSLIMTEDRAFLVQYDRNGVMRTQIFNIHERPEDFVYLILLVSSPDCATLGFDTSVYWKGDKRYIKTLNEKGEYVEYELVKSEPFFQRRTIRGRGTLCWLGVDPAGRRRIIKDSWQAEGRDPEHGLLEDLQGVKGVGQMVAFEKAELRISDLRGMKPKSLPTGMADRFFRRIILEAYGKQIDKFTTRMEFLCAFRDAVAGHQRMWQRNIIHRDISVNNILIGVDGAGQGWRGVVIDMDMAVRWQRAVTMAAVDFRTGTRAFQSFFVISSEKDKAEGLKLLPHDHLDDLESFFYVFCWVCMGKTQYGAPVECPLLQRWEGNDLDSLIDCKYKFLLGLPGLDRHKEVVYNFGEVFQTLFDALRNCFRQWLPWKIEARDEIPNTLKEMRLYSDEHYRIFLSHIDKAIEDLEKEEEEMRAEQSLEESPMARRQRRRPPMSRSPSRERPPSRSLAQLPAVVFRPSPLSSQEPGSSSGMKRTREERDAGGPDMEVDGEEALPASKRLQTRSLSLSQPETVPVPPMPAAATGAAPALRRSSRLRTGPTQSAPASIEPTPAPMARRQPTRSRNVSRSGQPTEVPVDSGAPSSNGTGSRSRNGSTDSGGRRTTSRGGTSGSRSRRQSAGSTGLRRGRSASRKSRN